MPDQNRDVAPGPDGTWFRTRSELLRMPVGWELLAPGDAALTRRVKAAGPSWVVQEKRGNKLFSRGVCAPTARIEHIRAELAVEREDPAYAKGLEKSRARRDAQQVTYVGEFRDAVVAFLAFSPDYAELQARVASAIASHATPVGSGTVARTQRISIEQRAASATIAWLRHQTTSYDGMQIARVRGRRRQVRQQLAQRSHELLASYRRGDRIDPASCVLRLALDRGRSAEANG